MQTPDEPTPPTQDNLAEPVPVAAPEPTFTRARQVIERIPIPPKKLGASLEIRVNGSLYFHAYIADEPQNDAEMLDMLREVVAMFTSPKVEVRELDAPSTGAMGGAIEVDAPSGARPTDPRHSATGEIKQ